MMFRTGFKSRFPDQRLQVNGAPFYYDSQNYGVRTSTEWEHPVSHVVTTDQYFIRMDFDREL